jgi:hypothetical protein
MFAGFDDRAAIYILNAAIGFTSLPTTRQSHGSSANFLDPLSVNVKKGATGRQRTWRPVAKARFRGREVTGRAFTLPIQRKIA